MRKIAAGIFVETEYRGVDLGVILGEEGLLLIDSPLYSEDGHSWLSGLKEHGRPRFLALLDGHPDRVLGARDLGVPILAHDHTRIEMSEWADTFKGATHQIGGDCDQLKRIKGVQGAVPELTFSEEMVVHLGDREVVFWHRPGPTSGAIWVLVPEEETAFLGDCVTVSEPPYIGAAEVGAWLESMDELRNPPMEDYQLYGGRDGLIERDDINAMARFLRKLAPAVEEMEAGDDREDLVEKFAKRWIETFDFPSAREEQVALRLRAGLNDLFDYLHPQDE